MVPPWQRERSWSPEDILSLLAEVPSLGDRSPQKIGEGFDNDVFSLGDDLWLRLPRRTAAVANLEREARWLPVLAPQLPLPVPTPVHLLRTLDEARWPVLIYRGVVGQPADEVLPAERTSWLAPVIGFLRALQHIPPAQEPGLEPPRGPLKPALQRALERIDATPIELRDGAREGLSTPVSHESEQRVWCHGDLYSRHLMLDAAGEVSGVIDFGDMHMGDPYCDLSVAWSWFEGEDRLQLMRALPEISEPTWRRARQFALFSGTTLCWAGAGRDDPAMSRAGEDAVRRALAGPLLPQI